MTSITRSAGAALVLSALTVVIHAQQPKLTRAEEMIVARSMEQPQPSAYPVPMPPGVSFEVLPVLGSVYLLATPTSNVVVQVGEEGAFVVDTEMAADSDQIVKAIHALTPGPISYLVNTSFDPEHFGGNENLAKAGFNPTLAQQNLTGPGTQTAGGGGGGQPARQEGAIIIAHENTLNRMSAPTGEKSTVPFAFWPSNTFFTPKKTLTFNDEPIELLHPPAAHTDGDVMVFFRHSDVIAAGDVINTYTYPTFDPARGGSIAGVLSALNDIIDIAIPRFNQMAGTRIVPGHGRILNEADVVEYRDMTTIIRDRVQLGIDKGMTLAQIKAQQPTLDYDGLYSTPVLTGEMYVEAIYNDLKKAPVGTTARSR
jgi:glyoxylase-like metal-dependent hydrolase (beta-lactamase superfamily II)